MAETEKEIPTIPADLDRSTVADITYIRLKTEFVNLAVILDRFSRKVVGWSLERTLASKTVSRVGSPQ